MVMENSETWLHHNIPDQAITLADRTQDQSTWTVIDAWCCQSGWKFLPDVEVLLLRCQPYYPHPHFGL